MNNINRRDFVKMMGAAGAATTGALLLPFEAYAGASGHVVVVGGGTGGATCANYLTRWAPNAKVTLIEKDSKYSTCFFSNEVIMGMATMDSITYGYDGLKKRGVNVVHDTVTGIDTGGKKVITGSGSISYDILVLSPGITFDHSTVDGSSDAVAEQMPHAWKAGPQTSLLAKQIAGMRQGGLLIIAPPENPFRCPPGPYERAALALAHFKEHNPTAQVVILDAKEKHSKQGAFREGWTRVYGGEATAEGNFEGPNLKWIKGSNGGKVVEVNGATNTVITEDGEEHKGDVVNYIPKQVAGAICKDAGLVNATGWCDVDLDFKSKVCDIVFVIGDASVASPMPKSGHSASSQAKNVAATIAAQMAGEEAPPWTGSNTCYSFISEKYGISVVAIYAVKDGKRVKVKGAGGVAFKGKSLRHHAKEAKYARGWYKGITSDMFG